MKKIFLPCLCVMLMIVASCSKPGTGGKATLSIHVFEGICDGSNRIVVPSAIVHIKYGGETISHTAGAIDVKDEYDDTQVADFGGKTVFEGLRRGWYYLYSEDLSGTKTGGTAFEIKNRIGEREVVICTGSYE